MPRGGAGNVVADLAAEQVTDPVAFAQPGHHVLNPRCSWPSSEAVVHRHGDPSSPCSTCCSARRTARTGSATDWAAPTVVKKPDQQRGAAADQDQQGQLPRRTSL